MPSYSQVEQAALSAKRAGERLKGKMEILHVLPDLYEKRPKPCMQGWGRRFITVNPLGRVLPCPNASEIRNLHFDSVRERSLAWIWNSSKAFERFRGSAWMPEPCQSCNQKESDFGGCRCQAALWAGEADQTDPVCEYSQEYSQIQDFVRQAQQPMKRGWLPRENPEVPLS